MNAPAPLSVLIVDDEAPARVRLRDVLGDIADELPNVVVGEAANGQQAVAVLADLAAAGLGVDVMLVDIRMPTMDGIELARHLAQLEHAPGVIFVTAYDNYAVHAFELNAIDYLVKPVRAQRLRVALQKVRQGRPALKPHVLEQLQQGRAPISRAASAGACCSFRWPTSSTCAPTSSTSRRAPWRASTCSTSR